MSLSQEDFLNTYRFQAQEEAELFDAFAEKSPYVNLCQVSAWGKVKDTWKSFRIALWKGDSICATALMLVRSLPLGLKLAYVPRGPLLAYEDAELLRFFVRQLKDFAKQEGCFLLKIDPPIEKNRIYMHKGKVTEPQEQGKLWEKVKGLLSAEGFVHQGFHSDLHSTIQPRFQAVILKEDWKNFKSSSVKSYVKLAQRSHVKAELATTEGALGKENLKQFHRCIQSTEQRQGIRLRNLAYFEKISEAFGSRDQVRLFLAHLDDKALLQSLETELEEMLQKGEDGGFTNEKKQAEFRENLEFLKKKYAMFKKSLEQLGKEDFSEKGVALASNLCLASGDTVEMLYAGTRTEFVKLYAQYLSYCHCFDTLFEQGYRLVNLGGISGDFKDGLSGFKGRFSPCIFEYLGEFDYTISPTQAWLYQAMLKGRELYLRLRKGLKKS